jgi:hypothetical protein
MAGRVAGSSVQLSFITAFILTLGLRGSVRAGLISDGDVALPTVYITLCCFGLSTATVY